MLQKQRAVQTRENPENLADHSIELHIPRRSVAAAP